MCFLFFIKKKKTISIVNKIEEWESVARKKCLP